MTRDVHHQIYVHLRHCLPSQEEHNKIAYQKYRQQGHSVRDGLYDYGIVQLHHQGQMCQYVSC